MCIEFCVGTPPGALLLPGTTAEVCFCVPVGDPGGGGGGTNDDAIPDLTIEDVPVERGVRLHRTVQAMSSSG